MWNIRKNHFAPCPHHRWRDALTHCNDLTWLTDTGMPSQFMSTPDTVKVGAGARNTQVLRNLRSKCRNHNASAA